MAEPTKKVTDGDDPSKNTITPSQQMISSCVGAVLTSVFTTPFDVVKVRLQSQQKKMMSNRCFLYCNGFVEELCCSFHGNTSCVSPPSYFYTPPEKYFSGTVDAFVKIVRAEGPTTLWSGLPTALVMSVPATVVYYTIYDQMRNKLTDISGAAKPPLWVPIVAGCSARTLAVTLISPLELVRTKMQSKRLTYVEIHEAIKSLVQSQGVMSVYRGLGPTFLRDVPFSVIYWANYELLKNTFHQETPAFWFSFAAGATAGTIAAVGTMPFDLVKTLRQIELGEAEALEGRSRISSYAMLKTMYQRNGFKALFTGIVPRVMRVAPACAIMISTYEYGKKFFRNYNASIALNSI